MKVLITGTSSGLGKALSDKFLSEGNEVYGLSRSGNKNDTRHIKCDLCDLQSLKRSLVELTHDISFFDYVILNAGILGRLSKQQDLTVEEHLDAYKINVLCNNIIIDNLLNKTKNFIGISSGASQKPYYGWALYCTSKAAFRQMLSVYAVENPTVHFLSLAPGIIKTRMQDYIYTIDESEIPSVSKFKKLYQNMDNPDIVAKKIYENLGYLNKLPSGSYFDLRER